MKPAALFGRLMGCFSGSTGITANMSLEANREYRSQIIRRKAQQLEKIGLN
jgi:hypothetical protein